MNEVEGARSFGVPAEKYGGFMGRYSWVLASHFVDFFGLPQRGRFLDIGCGPGALTVEVAERLGVDRVAAVDPSPAFVAACQARLPGVEVRQGRAEELPFETDSFTAAASQLVFHFVSDAPAAAAEMARVVAPGGTVAACVWDAELGLDLLSGFWEAAASVDPGGSGGGRDLRWGRPGELGSLMASAGLGHIQETVLTVASTYRNFDEVWAGFTAGIGPAGQYLAELPAVGQQALRTALFDRFGRPSGAITLRGTARAVRAWVPGEAP